LVLYYFMHQQNCDYFCSQSLSDIFCLMKGLYRNSIRFPSRLPNYCSLPFRFTSRCGAFLRFAYRRCSPFVGLSLSSIVSDPTLSLMWSGKVSTCSGTFYAFHLCQSAQMRCDRCYFLGFTTSMPGLSLLGLSLYRYDSFSLLSFSQLILWMRMSFSSHLSFFISCCEFYLEFVVPI